MFTRGFDPHEPDEHLERLPGNIALNALAGQAHIPRLVTDPPPYGHNASLRCPEHLCVRFDHLAE